VNAAIVHVASGREWRGGQRQVWLLARELGRLGIDQVVVTGRNSELGRRLTASGVRVRPATWRAGLDPRVIWPTIQELRSRPAIVHAHDGHAFTLASVCSALTGSPLVVTRRVTFPLRRSAHWQRAHRVIAISNAVRDALVTDGLEPERLVLIPSAVDLQDLQPSAEPGIRRRLGLPENGQVAVSLGALTPEKDQQTLIAAAELLVRDLPGLHWVVVGDGPLGQKLSSQIAHLGLQERVHLLSGEADPHLLVGDADVFVLSSTSEGLGSSALAAMALGVPVVATRVGGIPDLLGTGGGLLVPPRNPPALAAAVRRVLTDAELRQDLTQKARQQAARFSVGAMAERVLSVYRSCAHFLDGS
jgi:glycosyltransferase involved in cell wall biosynthesis